MKKKNNESPPNPNMNYLYVRGTKAGTKQKHVERYTFGGFYAPFLTHFDALAKDASTRQVQKLVLCDPYLWVRYQNNQVKSDDNARSHKYSQRPKVENFRFKKKHKPNEKIRFMLAELLGTHALSMFE